MELADTASKQPGFVAYPKIYNGDKESIRVFRDTPLLEPSCLWVAVEKVHGSNFGFVWNRTAPDVVRMQRRGGLLSESEKFHGVQQNARIKALAKKVAALFATSVDFKKAQSAVLFGEIYGPDVQKNIRYSDTLQFVGFDILVDERHFLSYDNVARLLEEADIPYAIAIKEGPLATLLGHFNSAELERLQSGYPAKHGILDLSLPTIAEGVVLRPKFASFDLPTPTQRWIPLLKLKRRAFRERGPVPPASGTLKEAPEFVRRAVAFVTPARLANVRSKRLTDDPLHVVANALAADAMEDISAETFFSALDAAEKTVVKRTVTGAAFALVKSDDAERGKDAGT